MSEPAIDSAAVVLEQVHENGVPNYFDDQRFGSVSGGEFVAKALVLGDFEKALRLALVAPYEHDRTFQKREKAILIAHWGDWATCKAKLPRGHARDLVDYLLHRAGDFRGAIARLRPELRGLYLSAFQSHLWNRMLAKWLRDHLRQEQLFDFELCMGPAPMHRQLEPGQRAELGDLQLPMPTARGTADPADPHTTLMQAILDEEGLTRDQLRVKGLREVFFSRGERAGLCLPSTLHYKSEADDQNEGRQKLLLGFDLPRGSYGTLIVKRLASFFPLTTGPTRLPY